jgi:hypothetical protein
MRLILRLGAMENLAKERSEILVIPSTRYKSKRLVGTVLTMAKMC